MCTRTCLLAIGLFAFAPVAFAQVAPTLLSASALTTNAVVYGVNAGDVNGDGVGDFIRSTRVDSMDPSAAPDERAYVYCGRTGHLIWTLESPNDTPHGLFGYSVAGAGDVNNDGFDDLIVGAVRESVPTSPAHAGRAYVFSGATGNVIHILAAPNEVANGGFGENVANLGDVNGDGLPDIGVASATSDQDVATLVSDRAYVFSGASGIWLVDPPMRPFAGMAPVNWAVLGGSPALAPFAF